MSVLTATPTGVHKAAVLLVQLGREKAAKVLAHMADADVERLSAEIARLEKIDHAEASSVLGEFRTLAGESSLRLGGLSVAQQLLTDSLGPDKAAEVMARINANAVKAPFAFLMRADPAQVRSFIGGEHPQVIALILAYMTPEKASMLMAALPPEEQSEIAHRIAMMDRTTPEIIEAVESTLERRMSSMLTPTEVAKVGGLDPLVNIINRSDRATERQIFTGLEQIDRSLADEIRSRMFMFEDIVSLDDRSMQQVVRQVPIPELALAIKGVAESVRNKVLANLSTNAASDLEAEVEVLGSVRLAQVEEAQQKVIAIIRELEEKGEILIRRGGDDEFVD